MRIWILLAVALHPALAAPLPGTDETDLKRRVLQLEQQAETLKKNYDAFVQATNKTIKDAEQAQDSALELEKQIHSKLQASGYADVEYRDTSNSGSPPGFRIHHFSLILTKQIDEHWRSFAEIEYEDAPRMEFKPGSPTCETGCGGQIFLEAMNVDYSPSDAVGVRFGRFFTPAGIWSIEHYPPFVVTQERPLHIEHIFQPLIDGVLLHGTVPVKALFLNYDLYAGNGEGSSGNSDNNTKKSLGLRAAFTLPWLTQFEIGLSANADTLGNSDQPETRKLATGLHTKLRMGQVAFQTEIARASFKPQTSAKYSKNGFYAQLGYDLTATTKLGYRYDVFNDYAPDTATKVGDKRNSVFANYRAHKNVVMKLEHHQTKRDNAGGNERLTIASVVVYLGE